MNDVLMSLCCEIYTSVPSFTTAPVAGMTGTVQEDDNPVTYTINNKHVTVDEQEHNCVSISDSATTMTQHACNNDDDNSPSTSSEDEENAPQSKADILAAAGVSINLEELQMQQSEQAPLELVTEV